MCVEGGRKGGREGYRARKLDEPGPDLVLGEVGVGAPVLGFLRV